MSWLWWWAAVSVVSAVLLVAVWWHEVGRHDADERRNRRLHDGHRAHAGWFDVDADADRARFLDRHRHDDEGAA